MAELNPRIEVVEELRPALLLMQDCEDMEVLVHTAKVGFHGGFIVEDEYGTLQEIIIDPPYSNLKYVDNKHAEYVFPNGSGGMA